MKRNTTALLLALALCLGLLSACGGKDAGDTGDTASPAASGDTASPGPTGSEPAGGDGESPAQSPEQSPEQDGDDESPEPSQAEPKADPASSTAAFLALLEEEYENGGAFWGHSAGHTCVELPMDVFVDGEDIFICERNMWYRYNTVTKELSEPFAIENPNMYIDGLFYCYNYYDKKIFVYDKTGALMDSKELGEDWYSLSFGDPALLEKGFVVREASMAQTAIYFSYDLKEQHVIPVAEKEAAHGIKEPVQFYKLFSADGIAYGLVDRNTLYKLNTDTWEWEEFDTIDDDGYYRITSTNGIYEPFYGKYVYSKQGVFDLVSGEQVFTFDEQYPAPRSYTKQNYITDHGVYMIWTNTYRLVDLYSSGISEKWARPEHLDDMTVIDGTYLVYWDEYGYFLWNALEGTEETIMMFEK